MKMIKYIVLMVAMVLCTQVRAMDRVYVPQENIIGANIANQFRLLSPDCSGEGSIYPIGVSIDVDAGKVTGVVFHYEKSVPIRSIEDEVNSAFREWQAEPLTNSGVDVRVWRVEPMRFTIQLSTDNEGNPKLVYIGWIN